MAGRKIFLDVGGHHGETVSAVVDRQWGFDAIWTFEPVSSCVRRLAHLAGPRVTVVPAGWWSEELELDVHDPGELWATVEPDGARSSSVERCRFVDASRWVADNIRADDLVWLKLNIEAAEVQVLHKLIDTGEIFKFDHVVVHFDAEKLGHHEDSAALRRRLDDAHVSWHDAREVLVGRTTTEKTSAWLALTHGQKARFWRYKIEHEMRRRVFRIRRATAGSRSEGSRFVPDRELCPESAGQGAGALGPAIWNVRRALRPGSPFRRALRARFPRVRAVVLAPRRARSNHLWRRRHRAGSVVDRSVLERTVLPFLGGVPNARVLFVGVDWYTKGYEQLVGPHVMTTIDIRGDVRQYGAVDHHTVSLLEIDRVFPSGTFSSIVCNGVLGHGVDDEESVETAFAAMRQTLSADGVIVIGWNDVPGQRPPALRPIAARFGLVPFAGAGLDEPVLGPLGSFRHVYEVFRPEGDW
jgi:hypothetical protein